MAEYLHNPPNTSPIDEILVVMSVDEGGHGICASILPGLGSTPLFSASKKPEVLRAFKERARQLAADTGKTIAIYEFTRTKTVWLCDPSGMETI